MRLAPLFGVILCLACQPADEAPEPTPKARAETTRQPSTNAPPAPEHRGPIAATTRQLIVVRGESWDDFHGRAQRFERSEAGGDWRAVGDAFDVVFGHAGLAWGRGLHGDGPPPGVETGPTKSEGDGRSPAGVFSIGAAYGRAPRDPASTKLPYTQSASTLRCVDDPRSAHYNRVVDAAEFREDWTSAEPMRRYYELAIVVEHNLDYEPGGGSCIFLHAWKGPNTPVTGCTAMAPAELDTLADWLEPGALLVTLPKPAIDHLREAWALP